jgi:hypothetical protein
MGSVSHALGANYKLLGSRRLRCGAEPARWPAASVACQSRCTSAGLAHIA